MKLRDRANLPKREVLPPRKEFSVEVIHTFPVGARSFKCEEILYVSDTSTESHYRVKHPNNKGQYNTHLSPYPSPSYRSYSDRSPNRRRDRRQHRRRHDLLEDQGPHPARRAGGRRGRETALQGAVRAGHDHRRAQLALRSPLSRWRPGAGSGTDQHCRCV